MRITDMHLKDGEDATLYHPIVGYVGWGEKCGPGSGHVLYFMRGREQGQPLVADHAVLFDDQWINVTGMWGEYERLCRLKEEAVVNQDFETAARYRDEADKIKAKWGIPK